MPILEFLSLRTFSSIWYWIAVAVIWAAASHRPMGVPYDMVWRAGRDEEARQALDTVARALAARLVSGAASGAIVLIALASALLTILALLGLVYGLELAQGALLIALPLTLVGWLTLRAARVIAGGDEPVRHIRRLRIAINAVGLVSLFVTAFWGMYVNFMMSVL